MTKAPDITIQQMLWMEDRGDWEIQYRAERNGCQTGVRYIELPPTATEQDIINFIKGE